MSHLHAVLTTEADAIALEGLIAQAMGLPEPGEPIPGGAHADVELSTTRRYVAAFAHPDDAARWACPVDELVEGLLEDATALARLTEDEQAWLRSALAQAVPLPADWEPEPFNPPLVE